MSNEQKILLGGLGGITPILANLVVIDLETLLLQLTFIAVIGYLIRGIALFLLGGLVAFLHKDEQSAIKLFQLGIMAPALVTAFMNGTNVDVERREKLALQKALHESRQERVPVAKPSEPNIPGIHTKKSSIDRGFSLVSSAYAAPPSGKEIKTFETTKETGTQQLLRGFTGSTPPQVWFVIVGSHVKKEDAEKQAQDITTRMPAFKAEVYAPYKNNPHYAVVIGASTNYDQAEQLRQQAIKAGVRKDAYLWTP